MINYISGLVFVILLLVGGAVVVPMAAVNYFYCNRFNDEILAQLVSARVRRGGNFPVAAYQW
jgi:hypothetical protein